MINKLIHCVNRFGAKMTLSVLLPYFSKGNAALVNSLWQNGYCSLLVNNPSLLIGRTRVVKRASKYVPYNILLSFLRRIIVSGSLRCPKGTRIMHSFGIIPFFANCQDNMLESTCRKVVKYDVPEHSSNWDRVAVYTVITGSYDKVHELLCEKGDADYILFTNNPTVCSNTWEVRYIESDLDNIMLSREVKMLPHKYLGEKYDVTIYVDGSASIYNNISEMSSYINEHCSFAVTRHSERNTVREELEACIKYKGVNERLALSQYQRYINEGFSDNIGLAECTILIRKQNDEILCSLMEEWWKEFRNGVKRDQISLLPCINRKEYKFFKLIDGCVWCNQYCVIGGHAQK